MKETESHKSRYQRCLLDLNLAIKEAPQETVGKNSKRFKNDKWGKTKKTI